MMNSLGWFGRRLIRRPVPTQLQGACHFIYSFIFNVMAKLAVCRWHVTPIKSRNLRD